MYIIVIEENVGEKITSSHDFAIEFRDTISEKNFLKVMVNDFR